METKRLSAFYQGKTAFVQGRLYDNPFKPNTLPYKEWEAGVNAAYFENLDKTNATS